MQNVNHSTNVSDNYDLSSAGRGVNWSTTDPQGCIVVPFTQISLLPDEGIVNADNTQKVKQAYNCLILLIFLIGGPTNVVNMAVFYRQGLKDRVTLCLFCLAFTDVFYLTSITSFIAEEVYREFREDGIGAHFAYVTNENLNIMLGSYYVSPVLSAIVAGERCFCVFRPLKAKSWLRTRTMAVIIFLVYVCVYSLSFVLYVRFRIGCMYDPIARISIRSSVEGQFYKDNKDLINVMDGVVFGVGVLGGTMVTVTISTALTTWKLRQISQWRSDTSSASISSRDVSLSKMLIGCSIWFVISVAPNALFNSVRLFFPEVDYRKKEHNLYVCCSMMTGTFVLVKPCSSMFVYFTMGSRFRETFKAMFGRRNVKAESATGLKGEP